MYPARKYFTVIVDLIRYYKARVLSVYLRYKGNVYSSKSLKFRIKLETYLFLLSETGSVQGKKVPLFLVNL
jgi:hypothetical protein